MMSALHLHIWCQSMFTVLHKKSGCFLIGLVTLIEALGEVGWAHMIPDITVNKLWFIIVCIVFKHNFQEVAVFDQCSLNFLLHHLIRDYAVPKLPNQSRSASAAYPYQSIPYFFFMMPLLVWDKISRTWTLYNFWVFLISYTKRQSQKCFVTFAPKGILWVLVGIEPLRKQAYSNVLKISPPKNESFQKKILIFFRFLLKT